MNKNIENFVESSIEKQKEISPVIKYLEKISTTKNKEIMEKNPEEYLKIIQEILSPIQLNINNPFGSKTYKKCF